MSEAPARNHPALSGHVIPSSLHCGPLEPGPDLPAAALDWSRLWCGVDAWIGDALTTRLPRVGTANAAEALVHLAPTFTGTIGELFDVAVAIHS